MKKSLLALAALTAFAGAASAQSSVTLFGVVDLAARSVKNGSAGSIKSLSQNSNSSSRLGFRGVEDLGGGLRAGFWLEGDFGADAGCGGVSASLGSPTSCGQTWQRRSTVSLLGNFGELRLGRDYTPSFWNHTVFDAFGTQGVASQLNTTSTLGSGATTLVRASNSIGYFLPSLGGIYGQVMVAAGEGATGNKYFGGRLGYGAGPVNVAVAYGKTEKTGTMADDFTDVNVGGSFNAGFMTVMGYFGKTDYLREQQKLASVGVLFPVGQSTFKASFQKASGTSAAAATDQYDTTLIGLGYTYDLSKRTAVIANFSRVNNSGTGTTGALFTASGSGPAGMLRGETSTGYEVGLRHNF